MAITALYYAAAAATAIAGMLHLMLGPNNLGSNVNQGILFIVGGITQVFWIIPMVRKWGTPWYAIGIGGTIVFMSLWIITRMPGNPITGRGGPAGNPTAITIEILQAAFIGLAAAILVYENRKKKPTEKTDTARRSRRQVPILAGIVVALVLAGLFALPMSMGRPMGGLQGQGGPPPGQQGVPPGESSTQIDASTNQTCTLTPSLIEVEGTPQQTEGPYFVDEMPSRSDIRHDTSDGSIQRGVPLNMAIHVYDTDDGSSCIPLGGALVDIWHTDSQGLYSSVQEDGTAGMNFLRGNQVTDDNGTVRFSTIYPGWYEGRAIHIHVKVRLLEGNEETLEWTSQFYLDDSINDKVHEQIPYSDHGPVAIGNEQDSIYTGASTDGLVQGNTGQHLMLTLTEDGQGGYTGTFNVVLDTT